MSARVDVAFLHLVETDFPGKQAAYTIQIGGEVVGMGDLLKSAGEQFGLGVADENADRAVDLEPAAIERDQRHADGGKLKRVGEAFLAFAQHFFRALVFVHFRLKRAVGLPQFLRPLVEPRQRL